MSQSQSQIKPIKINPELFTIGSRKVKNRTLKNMKLSKIINYYKLEFTIKKNIII